MDIEDFKAARFNIVGVGSRLKGELFLTGRSSVSGEIQGHLKASEGSHIILEKTSRVEGSIDAHDVEIHGYFKGDLQASGTLSLRPGSSVQGQIKAARLVVYPGAQLNTETEAG